MKNRKSQVLNSVQLQRLATCRIIQLEFISNLVFFQECHQSNSLDPNHIVGPGLRQNCLQRLCIMGRSREFCQRGFNIDGFFFCFFLGGGGGGGV